MKMKIFISHGTMNSNLKQRQISAIWISSSSPRPLCSNQLSAQNITSGYIKKTINTPREFKSIETERHCFKLSILRSLREKKIAPCFVFTSTCWCVWASSTVILFFSKWQIRHQQDSVPVLSRKLGKATFEASLTGTHVKHNSASQCWSDFSP